MSNIVRQENLFAAEDFTKIYKSFQDVSFTSYDFNGLKVTMINYIRSHFPEDFNDYVESSEFIAIIELLAFLGTSLAFRVDLNSRENILDTAQRRESIIRLARMINYRPKRNIAASGLLRLTTIQTDQPLTDSIGKSLSGVPVTWADPNNPDWFDQFITILNAVFRIVNPFGHPSKSATIGGISTDLYELNNIPGINVAYPITVTVNGEDVPLDIINPDIGVSITERHPDQNRPFSLIYRNDRLGATSIGTGFFLKFKQGILQNEDFSFVSPQPNRVQTLTASNVNETDVFVQEVSDDGSVVAEWTKVPAVAGNNIIFNSIAHDIRNIFEVIPGNNNQVSIKFADGNFGNIPTGIMRVWHRISLNRTIVIRPEDVQNKSITVGYVSSTNDIYKFNMSFNLEYTIANGSPTETNEEIKLRAPQVFYTQQRMINNEDYNVLPLAFGNQILKSRAINRTHAGHSRYIDINDPTGFHENLMLYGDDGAIYQENSIRQEVHNSADLPDTLSFEEALLDKLVNSFPGDDRLKNFFHAFYIPAVEPIYQDDGTPDYTFLELGDTAVYWKTLPDITKNDTGLLTSSKFDPDPYLLTSNGVLDYIKDGAVVKFKEDGTPFRDTSTSVKSVLDSGFPRPGVSNGPIELAAEILDGWLVDSVIPGFRTVFTNSEAGAIKDQFEAKNSFGLGYDLKNDKWYIIDDLNTVAETDPFVINEQGTSGEINRDSFNEFSWLMAFKFDPGSENESTYTFLFRGNLYIFESLRTVRFYFDAEQRDLDLHTGRAKEDVIDILPTINTDNEQFPLAKSILWKIKSAIIQEDGFRDPAKVEILPVDLNEDNVPDNPTAFANLVPAETNADALSQGLGLDEVFLRKFIDIDGYEKTRLWSTTWVFAPISSAPFLLLDISDVASQTADEMGFKMLADYSEVDPGQWTYHNVRITAGGIFGIADQAVLDKATDITAPEGAVGKSIATQLAANLDPLDPSLPSAILIANTKKFINALAEKTFLLFDQDVGSPGRFRHITETIDITGRHIGSTADEFHLSRKGRTSGQNEGLPADERDKFHFKWTHIAPADHRIDPSVSNIIDITVLTNTYYTEVLIWKDEKKSKAEFPVPPTTSELRVEYAELDNFKSISDQIIYSPGKFKLLFGRQADEELQAKFVAVKIPSAAISDSEMKSKIIQAIDAYFNINNWDFGERFFYTELAAYIHATLSKVLGSVVLVPRKGESKFGSLFEISSGASELFLSTATVADVEIVKNFTGTQLKI